MLILWAFVGIKSLCLSRQILEFSSTGDRHTHPRLSPGYSLLLAQRINPERDLSATDPRLSLCLTQYLTQHVPQRPTAHACDHGFTHLCQRF